MRKIFFTALWELFYHDCRIYLRVSKSSSELEQIALDVLPEDSENKVTWPNQLSSCNMLHYYYCGMCIYSKVMDKLSNQQ